MKTLHYRQQCISWISYKLTCIGRKRRAIIHPARIVASEVARTTPALAPVPLFSALPLLLRCLVLPPLAAGLLRHMARILVMWEFLLATFPCLGFQSTQAVLAFPRLGFHPKFMSFGIELFLLSRRQIPLWRRIGRDRDCLGCSRFRPGCDMRIELIVRQHKLLGLVYISLLTVVGRIFTSNSMNEAISALFCNLSLSTSSALPASFADEIALLRRAILRWHANTSSLFF